jgi:hypothetical protein
MTEKGLMVPNEDYVVVPLAVRDRIMQRLRYAEERAKELEDEVNWRGSIAVGRLRELVRHLEGVIAALRCGIGIKESQ